MSHSDAPVLLTGAWARLRGEAAPIRFKVFVEEQGIPAALEWDEADTQCLHCVAVVRGRAVATGRLLPDGHIGRMAVLPAWRGLGVGARVLRTLMRAAAARGHAAAVLSAQVAVAGFYAREGFVAEGAPYDEVGIPHQAMRRALSDLATNPCPVPAADAAPGAAGRARP